MRTTKRAPCRWVASRLYFILSKETTDNEWPNTWEWCAQEKSPSSKEIFAVWRIRWNTKGSRHYEVPLCGSRSQIRCRLLPICFPCLVFLCCANNAVSQLRELSWKSPHHLIFSGGPAYGLAPCAITYISTNPDILKGTGSLCTGQTHWLTDLVLEEQLQRFVLKKYSQGNSNSILPSYIIALCAVHPPVSGRLVLSAGIHIQISYFFLLALHSDL